LIGSGEPIGIAIGSLMIFLPAVAFWGIAMELRFGLRIEKLGEELKQENAWPQFPFELRPSGRPTKDSAQEVFEQFRQIVESDEGNWRVWFALGLAYDAAGDRPRARKAMRQAISLANDSKTL
jgi:tetratricopeptide (TPR) repeat protein